MSFSCLVVLLACGLVDSQTTTVEETTTTTTTTTTTSTTDTVATLPPTAEPTSAPSQAPTAAGTPATTTAASLTTDAPSAALNATTGPLSTATLPTGFINEYYLNFQGEIWFYPASVGVCLVIVGLVVGFICLIRCCCCRRDKDDPEVEYAPDLYAMSAPQTFAPLAYRGPATATDTNSLPIIHLPSALPKSGVLSGTERAVLPPTIASDVTNPMPPPSLMPPPYEQPPGGLPPPNAHLMASAPTMHSGDFNGSWDSGVPF